MAIVFRSGSTAGYASGGNLAINKPAGVVDGDILVAGLYREGSSWTLPLGWAAWGGDQRDATNQIYLSVAWKRASSEGASWTFNIGTGYRGITIGAYSGCLASGDPIDVGPTGYTYPSSVPQCDAITTATANAMCLAVHANFDFVNVPDASPVTGYARDIYLSGGEIWSKLKAATGSTGIITFGDCGSSAWATFHLALKPAATAATGGPIAWVKA